jgi:hypothetical protein
LLWILKEAHEAGLEFEPVLIRLYKAVANPFGRMYDARTGRAAFYRYSPRRIDRSPKQPYAYRPLVASTVFERMAQGQYAPISIHGPIDSIGGNRSAGRQYNSQAMDLVLDTVWWRRTAYWLMVLICALIIAFPWFAPFFSSVPDEQWGEVLGGSFIIPLVKMLAPGVTGRWIDAFASFPLTSLTLIFAGLTTFVWGVRLRDRVTDRARAAWQTDPAEKINRISWIREAVTARSPVARAILFAAAVVFAYELLSSPDLASPWLVAVGAALLLPIFAEPPRPDSWRARHVTRFDPGGLALGFARFVRTNAVTRAVVAYIIERAIPALFFVGIVFGGFYAVNGLGFALLNAVGAVCTRTDAKLAELAPGTAETRNFDIAQPCFATGIRLAASAKYRISFANATDWHDGGIDLAGFPDRLVDDANRLRLPTEGYSSFERNVPLYIVFGVPMRRSLGDNWLQPIAQLGPYGREYSLGPNSTLIEPQRSGELFLYVNDAVWGVPSLWDFFYRNNRGTVKVEIRAIEAPSTY